MSITSKFFSGFKDGAHNFGQTILITINSALLLFVYVIGVGLTFILAKLVSKHFLDAKLSKKKTYWSDLNLKKRPIERYYRQF